jgi:hypothetical protein
MMVKSSLGRRLTSRWTAVFTAALTGLAACSGGEQGGTSPILPPDGGGNPGLKQSAFVFDVDTRTGQVKVTEPTKNVTLGGGSEGGAGMSYSRQGGDVNFSILAGDAITLTTSNFSASTVGQYTPGKVRVKFDVNITNKLGSVELITPTFPTPPAGILGVYLFPFQTVVTTTSGGTSVGGDGTDVIIELPSYGLVESSIDWNGNATDASSAPGGTPFNFFNDDAGCGAGTDDCYRYEVFGEALAGSEIGIPAAATSTARTVGFDIDPTVGNFRARLIVAADLRNASGSAPVGTIAGVVSSPERGNLSGVTVNVSGGFSATTAATTGAYSIGSIPTGPRTVSLVAASLPAGCTNPASQAVTVANGVTSTVNFSVACTVPSGTIGGTITNSAGESISGTLTVTPTGLAAQPGIAFSGAPASYSATLVPVGTGAGSIALSGLPAQCTNPGAIPYSGLVTGGSLTVDVTVTCTSAPSFYQVSHTWSGTGSTRTLTIRIDMTTRNDPAVNGAGADDIGAFQGTLTYDAAALTPVAGNESATSSPRLGNVVANYATAGQIVYGSFDAVAGGRLGNVGIIQFDFTVVGSPAPGTTTSVTSGPQAGNPVLGQSSVASGSVNYTAAVIQVNAGTLTF